ncbi:serine hydrolase domain-containing protein [Amphiplicatus metriothermophilus]|uniref:CubicO group peptidase, beta-lactamase class C family n=1 Tax=Amphiplicatus metriothermophilus TaxID=1519374 RepID=A0A239PMN9_9PROT|nr:serine hydrolase [Amphiplicatus metriothermophilus]MBB5517290.1 CubicO group peptidase (beta-lactamase class C family) [Amphiplicatus metriothermophilus]SNT68374.1 CubicO group peptidase, beta-lactamase class C family [Amphiplicatus metriothermophilus]
MIAASFRSLPGAATLALLAALSGPARAQEADPAHLSLVAGYKAAFACSAHFNAGRSLDEIDRDELANIYADYREAMAALPAARIDEKNKTVSVAYAEGFPPRIAAWRPLLGCAQLPSGADASLAGRLPRLSLDRPRKDSRAEWPAGEHVAIDPDPALDAVVAAAFDRASYGEKTETTAVVVVKDGRIVAEKYRDGFGPDVPQRTWSVAKSIAATIIGAAAHQGLIAPGEPAGLAQWSAPGDPRAAITIENLLHMSSGLTSLTAGNRTDDVYFGGGLVVDHAIPNRLVAAPGTRWRYANNDTMAAMRALRERMGDDGAYWRFPYEKLLFPLGMNRTFLETDWNGDFVLSSQVWTTARDLARLGLLYLNDGVWNGARILPEGWAAFVATPAPSQPPEGRPGYGAQFWLFGPRHGLPEGSFAAMGNRGQYVMIVPERNVVVVRRGFDESPTVSFDIARFCADVLAALEAE